MKRTFDSLISQPLAGPEETWATLPGDLVRLLAGADPSLLPSLFVLSKHFHLSLALAPPMSDFWRDYFYSSLGLSDYVADVTKGLTWKGLVHLKANLTRTYYAKCARARFACGALRPDRRGFVCETTGCRLTDDRHRVVDWVEEKVKLCDDPRASRFCEVRPFDATGYYFGAACCMGGPFKFFFRESTQSIERWQGRGQHYLSDIAYEFFDQAAVPPSKLDPKDAWKVDKFYGFV